MATRLAYAGLWGALLVGLVGGGLYLVGGAGRNSKAAATVAAAPSPLGPSGWAVLFVQASVSAGDGTEGTLTPFLCTATLPSLSSVKPGTWAVSSATAVAAHESAPGYWSVTVAAQILGSTPSTTIAAPGATVSPPSVPLGTRYYTVGVQVAGSGFCSASIPMQVPAPTAATATGRSTAFGSLVAPAGGDPVADTTAQFLAALLAGQGEIGRYLAPGSSIISISPAPFAKVTVTGFSHVNIAIPPGAAPRIEVQASVECTDSDGRVQELVYVLDMTRLLGRWNVSRLIGAPPLAAP